MNSFLQGKKAFTGPSLRPLTGPLRSAATTTAISSVHAHEKHAGSSQPTVEVIKEGDKVVRLVVVCSCGERVEIDCLYPAG